VWTLFHSLAFDFSVWEMWGCLLTGGRLVVVPHWTARTPAQLAKLLRDHGVTVLSQTPSAFARLVHPLVDGGELAGLRLVVFGGEALRTPMLVDWLRHVPLAHCRLVNMFGITETTVHVTWHDVTAADVVANACPVGRALPGWSVTVRSPQGRILPFHVPGEICVGGAGLAIGYHGRPDLTAERFPTDPPSGHRYYRSGDLGRLRPDGVLEHLGRLDDQIKIRGYRVGLGEIRACLLAADGVRDAVVAFHDNEEGGAVHAYVVAAGPVSVPGLRRVLGRWLPDYMVPATLHVVASIPLTPNGKADLAALAEQAAGAAALAEPETAGDPLDPSGALSRVWRRLFGAGSESENFFDLGGSSLQALKLTVELAELGPWRLDPRDVYLNPTLEDLTNLLQATSLPLSPAP
jgi:acyl-coenzyme A synthetase/AMP-(fatty) acid ligase